MTLPTPPHIVFLDRDSLDATLHRPAMAHDWVDYAHSDSSNVFSRLKGATIAVTNKVKLDAATLSQLPELKMIAIAATGSNVVDLEACQRLGILACNIRGYARAAVPEHTFALILALRRRLLDYSQDVSNGKWQASTHFCFLDHPIHDLANSTLGIIGFGDLGQSVATIGKAFGMKLCLLERERYKQHDSHASTHTSTLTAGAEYATLEHLLATADVISLHLPLTPGTKHMISTDQLNLMKPTALLINTARGGLVDEQALADALRAGRIGGAGFDVLSSEPPDPDNPLLAPGLHNFILTPHVAWASQEAMQSLADQLIGNIEAYLSGEPRHLLN